MIRANVGLSKKLSQNYNSTGFTINLECEITASVNNPQAVIEQVKELYDLAEEALDEQIERHQSDEALASRDQEPATTSSTRNSSTNGNGRHATTSSNGTHNRLNGNATTNGIPATDKQINFLLTIAKRQKITTAQLEDRIAEVLGQTVGLYDLTKAEAGQVITRLTNDDPRKPTRRQAA